MYLSFIQMMSRSLGAVQINNLDKLAFFCVNIQLVVDLDKRSKFWNITRKEKNTQGQSVEAFLFSFFICPCLSVRQHLITVNIAFIQSKLLCEKQYLGAFCSNEWNTNMKSKALSRTIHLFGTWVQPQLTCQGKVKDFSLDVSEILVLFDWLCESYLVEHWWWHLLFELMYRFS